MKAGEFDRRITIESATFANDEAGDPIPTWTPAFKRWAKRRLRGNSQAEGMSGTLREIGVQWTVRDDSDTREIAPENYRIVYEGRVYVINGVSEAEQERHALRVIETTARPDNQGTQEPS